MQQPVTQAAQCHCESPGEELVTEITSKLYLRYLTIFSGVFFLLGQNVGSYQMCSGFAFARIGGQKPDIEDFEPTQIAP